MSASAGLYQLRASSLSGHEGFCQGTIRHKGKCVERLPVRMLLLYTILASDLQGAEKKSSIPRRLLFVFHLHSQIHCSDLPAGGALGLDASRPCSFPGGNQTKRFNHTSFGLQPLPDYLGRDIMSPRVQFVQK
ncbi:hypothetical protein AMECASPLE_014065 [Ameca splendens]|uniref:Uncharacterized protein n=1 Tax=Ameca splendens TaxID=208324 RepID=A0ABV0Y1X0_9TELE